MRFRLSGAARVAQRVRRPGVVSGLRGLEVVVLVFGPWRDVAHGAARDPSTCISRIRSVVAERPKLGDDVGDNSLPPAWSERSTPRQCGCCRGRPCRWSRSLVLVKRLAGAQGAGWLPAPRRWRGPATGRVRYGNPLRIHSVQSSHDALLLRARHEAAASPCDSV